MNDIRFRVTLFTIQCTSFTVKLGARRRPWRTAPQDAADAGQHPLWFSPPDGHESRRRALTRERVVAEALTVISADGAAALSMRALAARLGVVPGALYRHVRSKEQLCDLVVDGVLAEVDLGPATLWPGPGRSRCSPAVCGRSWKTIPASPPCSRPAIHSGRTPLPWPRHSWPRCSEAGLPGRETALAFSLVYDYTLGFALSDRTTVNEQRVQDAATRRQLHAFFRSLPADRFPALAALGEHVWAGNRDERFTAGLDTILAGLQAARRRPKNRPPRR